MARYELIVRNETNDADSNNTVALPSNQNSNTNNQVAGVNNTKSLANTALRAITIDAATQVVNSYVSLSGSQHLNDVYSFAQSSANFVVSEVLMTVAFGPVGFLVGLLSGLSGLLGNMINYDNNRNWDNIAQNVSIRRAGAAFNQSRRGN